MGRLLVPAEHAAPFPVWQRCTDVQILENTEELFSIRYTFGSPAILGLETDVTYTVNDRGVLWVDANYWAQKGRPQLPLLTA